LTLDYDLRANEGRLQDILLRVHRQVGLFAPLALVETYEALADLRRTTAFGKGIYPDALGVLRNSETLALIEMKHPNDWKTGHSALYQVLAYAGHFSRSVDADRQNCARELAAAFEQPVPPPDLLKLLTVWQASRTATAPLGNLTLLCIVPVHAAWEQVVAFVVPYGIDLRAVNASVLLGRDGEPQALSWFEIDPAAARVEFTDAFRWERPFLRFLAEHPAARLAVPSAAICERSNRDFAVRVSVDHDGWKTLVATFTPMTGEHVLVEVLDSGTKSQWQPYLLAQDDVQAVREIDQKLAAVTRTA
jgi:hypothetical protein